MTSIKRFAAALITALVAFLYTCAWAEAPAEYDRNAPQRLTAGMLYAQSALLVDEDSGEVLFTKNSRIRMYPASTTKIMTLLLALESGIPMDRTVTVPPEAGDIPEGSSVIPVKPGDELSFSDLLYGFMLSSGNDGANAIAVLVDGSIDAFVARMNARAAELGLEGTRYANAHGYHSAEHYTTAQDLAALSRCAMQNETFRDIVAAPKRTLAIRRGGKDVTTEIVSRNSLLIEGGKYYYPDCTGIKTGHHNKAGWCFVGSAQRDGKRVICVVLNCELEDQKWYDAAKLFEYGFTCYESRTVASLLEAAKDRLGAVAVGNADPSDPEGGLLRADIDAVEGGEQTVQLVSDSQASLDAALERVAGAAEIKWLDQLRAPLHAGDRIGSLSLTLDSGVKVSAALVASRDVAERIDATPTSAPATARPAQTQAAPVQAPRRGTSAVAVILAVLLALLMLSLVAAALIARNNRKRRRRRKRKPNGGKARR